MSQATEAILRRIRELQTELEDDIEARRRRFNYRLKRRRVVFEKEFRARQRQFKVRVSSLLKNPNWPVLLTAPIIYSLIIPPILLDIFVTIYQYTCFAAYGIPRVRRRDYLAIDRHHLAYLNWLEKLNCVYCGYANGLLALVSEVASRTEAYWCPIKHARRLAGTHQRYPAFADYGDAETFRPRWQDMRRQVTRADE